MKNKLLLLLTALILQFGILAQDADLNHYATNESISTFAVNLNNPPSEQLLSSIKEYAADNVGKITLSITGTHLEFTFSNEITYYGISKAWHILGIGILNVSTADGMQVMNFDQFASYFSILQP